MQPASLTDATRHFSAPANWDAENGGECVTLDVFDYDTPNGNVMVTAWIPDEAELQHLRRGALVFLHVHGNVMPVVGLAIQPL